MSSAHITIAGYLAADPQVNQAGNSTVCKLRVATNKRRGQDEITSWWNVSVWGKTGETCSKFLSKGRLVCISGEVYQRKYTDKDGNERMVNEVDASVVDFGFGKGDSRSSNDNQGSGGGVDFRSRGKSSGGWGGNEDDDPVPF